MTNSKDLELNECLKSRPDPRDYTLDNQYAIRKAFERRLDNKGSRRPKSYHVANHERIRIKKQFDDMSCTAQAGVSLLEYCCHERVLKDQDNGKATNDGFAKQFSPSFVYKCARRIWATELESSKALRRGCEARLIMKALVLFGAPPLNVHKYNTPLLGQIAKKDNPDCFSYAYAQNYQALKYYRLDFSETGEAISGSKVIERIKNNIWADLPTMFSMYMYQGYLNAAKKRGEMIFDATEQKLVGGHSMVVIGYDDKKRIGDSVGAFQFQNSYGEEWGDKGYGWLPYDYVLAGRTADWWCLIDAEDVNDRDFLQRKRGN